MKAKILLIIFILINQFVVAQKGAGLSKPYIQGTITDKDSGFAIKGVTINLIKKEDTLFHKATLTNDLGSFIFSNLSYGTYYLTITSTGYLKQITEHYYIDSLHPTLDVLIFISKKVNHLDEVIIRSKEQPYVQQQTDRITVNINTLTANNGSSALDALNNAPGVTVSDEGIVSLRGKDGVVIYINDKPSYLSANDLLVYLKSLPASQLDKIELMPNPSARYNAEGSAGIINIKMKKLKKKGINGNLSSSYSQGRYPKFNESANLNYAQSNLNLYGSAVFSSQNTFYHVDRSRTYDYSDNALNYVLQQQNNEINNRKTYTYRFGADYDLNKQTTIGIMFNGMSSPYHEEGQYRSAFTKSVSIDSILYSNSRLATNTINRQGNITLHHNFEKKDKEISIILDYLNYKNYQDQLLQTTTSLPPDSSRQNVPLITDINFLAKIYSVRADYSQLIFEGFKMESGAQTIFTTRNNKALYFDQLGSVMQPVASLRNSFRYKERIDALYVSVKKDIKRVSAQAGLRLEHTASAATSYELIDKPDSSFSLQYTNLFSTIYISYTADSNSKHMFNLSAGKRITRPNYQDLNPSSFFFDRNTSFTGNPMLYPETSTNLDVSYTYAKVWTTGLTFSHTKGMIIQAYEQAGQAYISSSKNIDVVNSFSLHSNLSITVSKFWNANLNAELTGNHYKGILFDVPVDTRGGVCRLSTYNQFTLGKGWSADLAVQYRGKIVLAQAVLNPTRQMHASVQKKISDRSVISLAGRDLFYTSIIQRTVTIPHVIATSTNISDSRYFTITFSYKFGSKAPGRMHKTGIENEQSRI